MRLLGEKGTERQDESFGAPISECSEVPWTLWGRRESCPCPSAPPHESLWPQAMHPGPAQRI